MSVILFELTEISQTWFHYKEDYFLNQIFDKFSLPIKQQWNKLEIVIIIFIWLNTFIEATFYLFILLKKKCKTKLIEQH